MSDKTGALAMTIADVQVARRLILAGITYDVGSGAPVIKWGPQLLVPIITVAGNGLVSRLVGYRRRAPAKTHSLTATWQGSAPTAKAMWATTWSDLGTLDLSSGLSQAATASPNSGVAQTSNVAVEAFIGCMGSEGPLNDADGTASDGYTLGQVAATSGGGAASNIKCREIFKIVSATESTQAALTGVTSRDWSSVLVTFSDDRVHEFNVTQYDQDDLHEIFNDADLDTKEGYIQYNDFLDRNEMFHHPDGGAKTLKATWKPDTAAGWVTV